jgi:hypothetical protein
VSEADRRADEILRTAARPEDAEDVLHASLRPDERVLWLAQPDRGVFSRAFVWGLGCLPFTIFLAALLVATLVLGSYAARAALGQGKFALDQALPATIGGLVLAIFLYPILVAELARRERRYVITSQRALVIDARRLESAVDLARVREVAPHKDLFDDTPTGVELRVGDGTAAIVFRDLARPAEIQKAVETAIATALGR